MRRLSKGQRTRRPPLRLRSSALLPSAGCPSGLSHAPRLRLSGCCTLMAASAQVMQTLSEEQRADMTPLKLRRKARDFALKTVNSQRAGFKRCAPPVKGLGVSLSPRVLLPVTS